MRVAAIVPAAGEGRRMAEPGRPSKQVRLLAGRPVLAWSLEALLAHAAIEQLIVAGPADDPGTVSDALGREPFLARLQIVAGGASRRASVERGLEAVGSDIDLILVHDAVRPFLPHDVLDAVIAEARRTGAAAVAVPAADTLRRAEGSRLTETIDRTGVWRMQTPQVARADMLRAAFATQPGLEATDEVELLRAAGHDVAVVEGSALTFKITTSADWEMAQALAPVWAARRLHGD